MANALGRLHWPANQPHVPDSSGGTGNWQMDKFIPNAGDLTPADGEIGVPETGPGTVTLSANNGCSRNTTILGGTLSLFTNTALGFGGRRCHDAVKGAAPDERYLGSAAFVLVLGGRRCMS